MQLQFCIADKPSNILTFAKHFGFLLLLAFECETFSSIANYENDFEFWLQQIADSEESDGLKNSSKQAGF